MQPLARALWHTPQSLARAAIRVYRWTLSPLIGMHCRHLPTCSEYGDEAIARHGFWVGGWMTAARLCRCHPWGSSGFDPVPSDRDNRGRWYLPWHYGRWSWRALELPPSPAEVPDQKARG